MQATIRCFLLCTQTEIPEVWIILFIKLYLGVLHFQIKFSLHITFPKQVIAIYYNIVIGAFQWKNGYIYPRFHRQGLNLIPD